VVSCPDGHPPANASAVTCAIPSLFNLDNRPVEEGGDVVFSGPPIAWNST